MQNIFLQIDAAGMGKAPYPWFFLHRFRMQRLYYIRGGTGYIVDAKGQRTPFEKNKIYIYPYNLFVNFESTPDDPLDHVYFDFISTPPIIHPTHLCYDVPMGSSILHTVEALQSVFSDFGPTPLRSVYHVADALPSSREEQSQIVYYLFRSLLLLLSRKRPIPFSSDEAICSVLELIRRDYAKPLTLADMAAVAGYDTYYFIRRFKSAMGVTPYAYLMAHRLIRAGELISQGLTLSHVAELVGYESASSLSRALKNKCDLL